MGLKLKLDASILLNMKLFGDITRVPCSDCFAVNDTLIFITSKGNTGRAIGPQGKNIKLLRSKTGKNIKIMEQSDNCCGLVSSYVFPVKPKNCEVVDQDGRQIVQIEFNSSRERRYLLDNQLKGLKELKAVVSRYYPDIKDVRIL